MSQLLQTPLGSATAAPAGAQAGEHAAKATLKAQIAKLERELSQIVAATFPHMPAPLQPQGAAAAPCLPTLADLECARDALAARVQQLRAGAAARTRHEQRARELLERIKLEPGRYKFVRLPVSDLGEGGCGVWEVRPRWGIIGMLAGWWELKLSSGCPLAGGPRGARGPAPSEVR